MLLFDTHSDASDLTSSDTFLFLCDHYSDCLLAFDDRLSRSGTFTFSLRLRFFPRTHFKTLSGHLLGETELSWCFRFIDSHFTFFDGFGLSLSFFTHNSLLFDKLLLEGHLGHGLLLGDWSDVGTVRNGLCFRLSLLTHDLLLCLQLLSH